ncbi:MAG: uridine kinase [Myxococcales bacterium]|nr:uridine kinase [Myxococcales bacterium]
MTDAAEYLDASEISHPVAPAPQMVIGIAGGTGSGKTTVARNLARALPEGSCVTIEHDAYYHDRSDVSSEERGQLNFDHPAALDSDLLVQHILRLRSGGVAEVPIYDFKTHRRLVQKRIVAPAPLVIVEGILVLAHAPLRELLDLKIFVDTDADIRIMRRVRRDIEERGRTFASVREQYYRTVRPMHLEFVEPSKRWADLVIPEGGANRVALDTIVGKLLYTLQQGTRAGG